jgi:hypothetical protein
MDEKLAKALEFSNYRLTLNNQKKNLKTRMRTMLTIGYNGAMFTVSLELVNFIKHLLDLKVEQYVFLDDNENPVMIKNLLEFHTITLTQYTEAMNEYYVEYEKLKKLRDTKKLVGLNV